MNVDTQLSAMSNLSHNGQVSPLLSPCDVGQHVTVYFGSRPRLWQSPVVGTLAVVRWNRSEDGRLLVSFDVRVEQKTTMSFDLADADIQKIVVGRQIRTAA